MNNTALVISTFDKSKDLWFPLEKTYRKYWSDIDFPIYLTTNHEVFENRSFKSLTVGDEISWSDNMIKSLNKISENYIFLTFDDLFLTEKVDNTLVNKIIKKAIDNDFNYLQFYRSISSGRRIDKLLFEKSNTTLYKNSTIWSFWKKDILLELLIKTESAWEFERKGNERSFNYKKFYSTRKNIISFVNGVVKGKWNPKVITKLNKMGIEVSSDRSILSSKDAFKYKLRDLQFDFLTYLIHKIY